MNNKEYYQVGGTLMPDDPSYIEREADQKLYEGLKAGNFCYVFNSRQMGKSSLQVRVKRKLENEGFNCAVISLDGFGNKGVTPDQWYYTFIKNLAETFKLQREQYAKFWQDNKQLTPLDRLKDFFSQLLLPSTSGKIIIFIDEIDAVLGLDFPTDDFFAFIRYCYNHRADDEKYKRITFALLGVATPSQLIKNSQITPFNIGQGIQLNWFSFAEAHPLAKGLESRVSPEIAEDILREVLKWTGGQPFLTQKICKIITGEELIPANSKEKISEWVKKLVTSRIINDWETQDEPQHLRTIRDRIINSAEPTVKLLKLYLDILQQQEVKVDDSLEQSELILSGLVLESNRNLQVSNLIYKCVFDQNWVAEMLAEKRPYDKELIAWTANKNQSWLLRGKKLQQSIKWAAGKNLTIEDYQFLNASQELAIKLYQHNLILTSVFNFIFVFVIGIIGFQLTDKIKSIFIPYILKPELFSQGEKSFLNGNGNFYQASGIQAFKQGDYKKAIEMFKTAKQNNPHDPEAEIYYNNALANQREKEKNIKPLTMAVPVPMYVSLENSREILRGVAQAQNEFNNDGKNQNQRLLNVVIANDYSDDNLAKTIAREFIKDSNVLAVIGHYTSQTSTFALPEYQKADLAMISPSSSSDTLKGKTFFRTIASNKEAVDLLVKYAINNKEKPIKRAVVYYQEKKIYSKDLMENFKTIFEKQGEVVKTIDLSNPNLDPSVQLLSNIVNDRADAVVLFPSMEVTATVIEIFRSRAELERLPNLLNSSKNLALFGGDSLYNLQILKNGKNLDGLVLAIPWFAEDKRAQAFTKKACERWKDGVSWRTAGSYDATKAFLKAATKSPNPTRKTIVENLKSINLSPQETSGYPLKFTDDGNRLDAKTVLVRVKPVGSGAKTSNNGQQDQYKRCKSPESDGYHFELVPESEYAPKESQVKRE